MTRAKKATGKQYRALVGIAYPTSEEAIVRIQAGEKVPWSERAVREVAAGEVVGDIPEASLGWLLDQGHIEPAGYIEQTETEEVSDDEVG